MEGDFKPGDEVTRTDDRPWLSDGLVASLDAPLFGEVHIVAEALFDDGEGWIVLEGWPADAWIAARFRKVQRRDLTAWLSAENTIEEPKRAPAKKRERVE